MKRTLALILTMLMLITMIPASLLSVSARGPGVKANGVQNQSIVNAPDQYIPETIVVDGKVRDTGWEYNDWNKVNSESGTWNVQYPSESNLPLAYTYQLKTDYYFLYGGFIIEQEVKGPLTVWINNGQGDNTYTHKFVFDLQNKTAKRLAADGTEIVNRSPYDYDKFVYEFKSPAPGRTIIEFKTLLADFCPAKNPKLSYFVSVEADNNEALYYPAINVDEGYDRNDYLPSLTIWPKGAIVIDTEDINGYGERSVPGAITVDGDFKEAAFTQHTNFYSRWFERLNVVEFANSAKTYAALHKNRLGYTNLIGGEHELLVTNTMIYGAAIIQDDNNNSLTYYDTLLIYTMTMGSSTLQVVLRYDASASSYHYAKAYLNGTDVSHVLKWGAIATGGTNMYSFEFSIERANVGNFLPDEAYSIGACAYPGSSDSLVAAYTSTGTGNATYFRNPIGEWYEPYTYYVADGTLGVKAWPAMTSSASSFNGNWFDSDKVDGRNEGLKYLHSMELDYEYAYGAVHISYDGKGSFGEWKHGNANNPNGADYFSVYVKNSNSSTGLITRYDMWTYLDGEGNVVPVIGGYKGTDENNSNTYYLGNKSLKVGFSSGVDSDGNKVWAFEYGIPLSSIEGIKLDYNQSIADGTSSYIPPEILQYYTMFNVAIGSATPDSAAYNWHSNLIWPKTNNPSTLPTEGGHTWTENPARVTYENVLRVIEPDGALTEEVRLTLDSVTISNATYRKQGTKNNFLHGYKKFYVGKDYGYYCVRFDGDFNDNGTKVTIWIKSKADGKIHSYEFYRRAGEFQMRKDGVEEYINGFYYAFSWDNGATNFELVFPLSDFNGGQGFEYFAEIQQVLDNEVVQRVAPAIKLPEIEGYANYFDLNGSEWKNNAGTPVALGYFFPESVTVDGKLTDNGWDSEEWIYVSRDANASGQETNDIPQLFETEFYYQIRFDTDHAYVAAVIKYKDGYYYDQYSGQRVDVIANKENIIAQEPSFRLWLKEGNNGSSTDTNAANTYTSYYNVQLKQDGTVKLTNQINLFPTYANNTRPLYDKYFVPVVPQMNEDGTYKKDPVTGQILFETATSADDKRRTDTYAQLTDSNLFGHTEYIIDEQEGYVVNENGQTFGETLNPEQYAEKGMLKDTVYGVDAGTIRVADSTDKFAYDGNTYTLDDTYAICEFMFDLSEIDTEYFQYYVSTGTHAPSWNGSKATVYPSISIEPESQDDYFHKNYPYWYWRDNTSTRITEALRQDWTLRTYEKPVITLGAKVNKKYTYYDEASDTVNEVTAIRFGGLWTEEYIRKVNGLEATDGYNKGNYTDYWDVKSMGMVILPTHLTKYSTYASDDAYHPGRYNLFVDTPNAAVVDAEGIVNWKGDPNVALSNNFADYENFAFYVTVVNAPVNMNFCFRGFVTYYQDVNGSLPYYDVVLERGINMVIDQSYAEDAGNKWYEHAALPDAEFKDEHGAGAQGGSWYNPEQKEEEEEEEEEEVIVPAAPANENTIAYIPLDNRPVNVDRVQYLAASAGYDLRMPDAADYATIMDGNISYGDEPANRGGDRKNLLYWLKSQELAGVTNYVISLDQMFSGGLVTSRVTTEFTASTNKNYEYFEYEVADYLIELAQKHNVAFGETLMRLAPEEEYQNYTLAQYELLRTYNAQQRLALSGDNLNIATITANYGVGANGSVLSTYVTSPWSGISGTVNQADIDRHFAARARKLKLIDYVINNAGNSIEHLFIAVDDSASGDSIQANERAYINQIATAKGITYEMFAGTDELGMLGVAALASDKYYTANNLPVNVVYFGTGENDGVADDYDYASLATSINTHLAALGATNVGTRDVNTLQVLVLTRSGDNASAREAQAELLVATLKENLSAGYPTVVLDCSNPWANNDRTLSNELLGWSWGQGYNIAETLGISCWNTVGNTIGIGLSNAIGRFAYIMNNDIVTDKSNEGFIKSMTFALIKDISYRAHTEGNVEDSGDYTVGHNNFMFEHNAWDDVNHILEKLNKFNTILGAKGKKVNYGTISIGGVSWPWRREFEARFNINVGTYVPPVIDDDFVEQSALFNKQNPGTNPEANNVIFTSSDYKTGTAFQEGQYWYRALLEYDNNADNYKVIAVDPMGTAWKEWSIGVDRIVIASHDSYSGTVFEFINKLKVGQRVSLSGTGSAYSELHTNNSGNIAVTVTTLQSEIEVTTKPEVLNPTLSGGTPNNTIVAYVPLDDRPVHTDRITYLAASSGMTVVTPKPEDYSTVLGTDGHGGNPENILAWLREQEAKGVDYYVISLDQVFSGGLVNSRYSDETYSDTLEDHDLAAVRFLTQLAKDNYVVFSDTVMRLASTVDYKEHTSATYTALRNYGQPLRQNLVEAGKLTLDNVISSYRYGTNGVTAINRTLTFEGATGTASEDILSYYLRARERKLRIIDYLIKNAGANINTLMVGIDDSSAGWNLQANEVAYIRQLISDYGIDGTVFAGADEMGVAGLANVAAHLFTTYGSVPVNVKYYGPAADATADKYDSGTLRESVNLHLQTIGGYQVPAAYINDPSVLQVLVLTRAQTDVSYTGDASEYAAELAAQVIYNLENNIPTTIIDASNHYGGKQNYALTALVEAGVFSRRDATELLGYSEWNTVGNAVGVGLGNAIARYAYINNADEITEKSNMGFLQTLAFSFIKDSTYKGVENTPESWNYNTVAAGGFTANMVLGYLNASTHILVKNNNSIADGLTIYLGEKTLPWGRTFEARLPIIVSVNEGDDDVVELPADAYLIDYVNRIYSTTLQDVGSRLFASATERLGGDIQSNLNYTWWYAAKLTYDAEKDAYKVVEVKAHNDSGIEEWSYGGNDVIIVSPSSHTLKDFIAELSVGEYLTIAGATLEELQTMSSTSKEDHIGIFRADIEPEQPEEPVEDIVIESLEFLTTGSAVEGNPLFSDLELISINGDASLVGVANTGSIYKQWYTMSGSYLYPDTDNFVKDTEYDWYVKVIAADGYVFADGDTIKYTLTTGDDVYEGEFYGFFENNTTVGFDFYITGLADPSIDPDPTPDPEPDPDPTPDPEPDPDEPDEPVVDDKVITSIELVSDGTAKEGNPLFAATLASINGDASLVGVANSDFFRNWYDVTTDDPLYGSTTWFIEGSKYDLFAKLTIADGYRFADTITYTLTTADGTYTGAIDTTRSTDTVRAFDFIVTGLDDPKAVVISVDNVNGFGTAQYPENTSIWAASSYSSLDILDWSVKALLEYDDNTKTYRVIATEGADTYATNYQAWDYGIDRIILSAHGTSDDFAKIQNLKVGDRLAFSMTHENLIAASGLTGVTGTLVELIEEDVTAPKVEAVTPPALTPNSDSQKVAYVPLDDRPVNIDRVIYSAASAGMTIVMPNAADYSTTLGLNSAATVGHGGNPANILAWLKAQEAAGVDHYVISLDQVFSGGLVASREYDSSYVPADGGLSAHDKDAIEFLTELAKNNYVVYIDTVIRLAMTTGNYRAYGTTDDRYHALRNWGVLARENLAVNGKLTLENVIGAYRYGADGISAQAYPSYGSVTIAESDLDALLNARERKLRIIDALIKSAGGNIDRLIIGLDDANVANHNLQSNEVDYINMIAELCGANYYTYAGADELCLMGIAAVTSDCYSETTSENKDKKVPVNVVYFGNGADWSADQYDNGTLRQAIDKHLASIGAYQVPSAQANAAGVIQVLVLTRGQSTLEVSTGSNLTSLQNFAAQLAEQVQSNLNNNIPTIVLDCSNHYGANANYAMTALRNASGGDIFSRNDFTELLGFSKWNTIGNTIGLGLASGIARYNYLVNADVVTEESNMAFIQYLTYSYIKDVVYRPYAAEKDGLSWNFSESTQTSLYYSAEWFRKRIANVPFGHANMVMLGKDLEQKAFNYNVSLNNLEWPWNREFEASWDVIVTQK